MTLKGFSPAMMVAAQMVLSTIALVPDTDTSSPLSKALDWQVLWAHPGPVYSRLVCGIRIMAFLQPVYGERSTVNAVCVGGEGAIHMIMQRNICAKELPYWVSPSWQRAFTLQKESHENFFHGPISFLEFTYKANHNCQRALKRNSLEIEGTT